MTVHIPSPRLTTFAATYNFKAPLPLPEFLRGTEEEDEAEDQDSNAGANGLGDDEPVQVTINAGIAGNLARPQRKVTLEYENDSTKELHVGDQPHWRLDSRS